MYIERLKEVARYAKYYDIAISKKFNDEVLKDLTKKYNSIRKEKIDQKKLMNIFCMFLNTVYGAAIESKFDFKIISKELKCSYEKAYRYVQDYEILHHEKNGYTVKKGIRLSPSYYILNELMYAEFIEHICKAIDRININTDMLALCVPKFAADFYGGNTLVQKSLLSKIKMYEKFKKRDDQKSLYSIDIINEYLNGSIGNIEKFCKENNKSLSKFKKELVYLEEIKHPLYQEFYRYKQALKEQELNELYNIACDVIEHLKNGVLEDGRVRDYDIIDYLTTYDIETRKLIQVKDRFTYDDVVILSLFIQRTRKHMNDTMIGMKYFLEIDKSNECERPLTDEEKILCIKMLESMGVSKNIATCNAMAKRYLNGFVELSPKVIRK